MTNYDRNSVTIYSAMGLFASSSGIPGSSPWENSTSIQTSVGRRCGGGRERTEVRRHTAREEEGAASRVRAMGGGACAGGEEERGRM